MGAGLNGPLRDGALSAEEAKGSGEAPEPDTTNSLFKTWPTRCVERDTRVTDAPCLLVRFPGVSVLSSRVKSSDVSAFLLSSPHHHHHHFSSPPACFSRLCKVEEVEDSFPRVKLGLADKTAPF